MGDQKAAWPLLESVASEDSQGGWRIATLVAATSGQRVAVVALSVVETDVEAMSCEQSRYERCLVRPAKRVSYLWPRWLQARDHYCRLYIELLASCNSNDE